MRRFFFDPENKKGETVTFSREESKHISKVLRLGVGTPVQLLDGSGTIYSAEIAEIDRLVSAVITGTISRNEESQERLVVCQAILKGEKMDTVVQKCTELGATVMVPFHSSRCQGKLAREGEQKKHGRWERIGLAACKQCMRALPMEIAAPVPFEEALSGEYLEEVDVRLLFWEEEHDTHLADVENLSSSHSIAILLGPEGGLSAGEVALAAEHGWIPVSLGKRILRAETATLTAASIVQYLAGRL